MLRPWPRTFAMKLLNFSGAPALLVPKRVVGAWQGILLETPEPGAGPSGPDFVTLDGRRWFMRQDFAEPDSGTHYGRLCRRLEREASTLLVEQVGDAEALVISDGSDVIGWWPEGDCLVTSADAPPSRAALASCAWDDVLTWSVHDAQLELMNSACHGEQLANEPGEHAEITLATGTYRVQRGWLDNGTQLYRLLRVP